MSGGQILLIEDDGDLQDLFAMTLRFEGYEVTTLGDGREVLQAVRARQPDLVVLDFTLPGMSGLEVITAMRRDSTCGHVPVLLVTGNTDITTPAATLDIEVLFKPFRPADLVRRVALLLAGAST